MIKKIFILFIALFSYNLFSAEKITVAVLPFSSVNGEAEGDTLVSMFANELSKRKVYKVLTRNSQMEKVMKELNFQRQGLTDENTIIQIGRALNAQYVLAGNISKLGRNNILIVSMINVETFENITGDSKSFRNIEDVIQFVPQIINEITGTRGKAVYSEPVTDSYKSTRILAGSGSQEAIDRILMKREGQEGIREIKSLTVRGLDTQLKQGASSFTGFTPLMIASYCGYDDLIEALIAAGANVNYNAGFTPKMGGNSCTALRCAIENNKIKATAILIDYTDNLETTFTAHNHRGYKYLTLATEKDNIAIVKLLVEAGADIDGYEDKDDKSPKTALMIAIEKKNYDIVKYLLEHRADPNKYLKYAGYPPYNRFPIDFLMSPTITDGTNDKCRKILKLLFEYGADPDAMTFGNTYLHGILKKMNIDRDLVETVKLLLMEGADPNMQNINGKTALQIFEERNSTNDYANQIVKILLDNGAE